MPTSQQTLSIGIETQLHKHSVLWALVTESKPKQLRFGSRISISNPRLSPSRPYLRWFKTLGIDAFVVVPTTRLIYYLREEQCN